MSGRPKAANSAGGGRHGLADVAVQVLMLSTLGGSSATLPGQPAGSSAPNTTGRAVRHAPSPFRRKPPPMSRSRTVPEPQPYQRRTATRVMPASSGGSAPAASTLASALTRSARPGRCRPRGMADVQKARHRLRHGAARRTASPPARETDQFLLAFPGDIALGIQIGHQRRRPLVATRMAPDGRRGGHPPNSRCTVLEPMSRTPRRMLILCRAAAHAPQPDRLRQLPWLPKREAGYFLAAALRRAGSAGPFAGPLARFSASSSTACSRVSSSRLVERGTVMFVTPSVMYGPNRPSLTTMFFSDTGSTPNSASGAAAVRPPRVFGCE